MWFSKEAAQEVLMKINPTGIISKLFQSELRYL